ncbi:MAG: pentapeptide repeat-containing protein [Gemmatimonadetes bacterium]|nr:pentapeptide repeat-containing protein [Gemmatimonadota bacterium]
MPSQLLDTLGPAPVTDSGLKDYRDRDLAAARFPGLELSEADFSYAVLDEADWPDAVLESVIFYQTSLDQMNLVRGRLSRVNLAEASMERSCLAGARLSDSTKLWYTVLRAADLSGAHLVEMVTINNSDLSAATCANLHVNVALVSQSSFAEAQLPDADLEAFELKECDFTEAKLPNAKLRKGTIEDCDFSGADLRGTVWETIRGTSSCRFDGALIEGATMPRRLMSHALATGAVRS